MGAEKKKREKVDPSSSILAGNTFQLQIINVRVGDLMLASFFFQNLRIYMGNFHIKKDSAGQSNMQGST